MKVLVYGEQNRVIAQALDVDVMAQGLDVPDALYNLQDNLVVEMADAENYAKIGQAPYVFWTRWQQATGGTVTGTWEIRYT